MKIAIANDHSAVELKNIIKEHLESNGYEVLNLGTDSTESCDYPVYGEKVGRAVADGEADLGIAICGTGVGISLAANKVKGIRACVCSEPYTAKLSRMHNNSNILAFGARVVGSELAKMIVDEWLNASFEGGRHQRRVDMIMDIDDKNPRSVPDFGGFVLSSVRLLHMNALTFDLHMVHRIHDDIGLVLRYFDEGVFVVHIDAADKTARDSGFSGDRA